MENEIKYELKQIYGFSMEKETIHRLDVIAKKNRRNRSAQLSFMIDQAFKIIEEDKDADWVKGEE
jgi:hypothetical protein